MKRLSPARLAEIPPSKWIETRRRVGVVRRYLAIGAPTLVDHARHAQEIGVGHAMFDRLVALVRTWDEMDDALRPRRIRRSPDAAARIADLAVSTAGAAATQEEAYATALRISAEEGVPPPGRQMIQTAHRRAGAGAALARRLGLEEDLVVDASTLGASVLDGGRSVPTVLTAVIDVADGRPTAWKVTAGRAGREDLARLLDMLPPPRDRRLTATTAFGADDRVMLEAWGSGGSGRSIAPGSVLVAAIGDRVGSVALLPRTDAARVGRYMPEVELADLEAVVDAVLAGT